VLAIAHRRIRASRSHISTNRIPTKALPTTVNTLGDRIMVKRFERGLSRAQLARLLGVMTKIVVQWENDLLLPHDCEREALAKVLSVEESFLLLESNR
jgi:ribosome-binding protein aMBF1 (putative translation factor)